MSASGFRRWIKREGAAATITEYTSSGSDRFEDPSSRTESTTTTQAIVRLRGQEEVTVLVAGERVMVDAEILVPDDVSITVPKAGDAEEFPRIEVGGDTFRILTDSTHGVQDGGILLFGKSIG